MSYICEKYKRNGKTPNKAAKQQQTICLILSISFSPDHRNRRTSSFMMAECGWGCQRPKTEDRRPKTEDRRPKTEDRRPKTEDRRPKTEEDNII
jgi:hypothetical protein